MSPTYLVEHAEAARIALNNTGRVAALLEPCKGLTDVL